jgi:translation initiation factor 3 subunit E
MLAEKLNMSLGEAEKWIVDLIRNARLDAKIDSKLVGEFLFMCFCCFLANTIVLTFNYVFKGHVVFGAQVISPNQQIIEKTRNLATKANTILGLIDKKLRNIDTVSLKS